MTMRKLLMMTALTASVFGFTVGAQAEGDAAIRSNSTVNTDASMSSVESGTAEAQTEGQTATMEGENVTPRTFDVSASSDAQAIIAAQQALRANGYVVAVDGIWGPQTAAAIREHQSAQNEQGRAESGAGAGMSMGNESSVSNSRANNSLDSAGDSGTGGY